MSKTYKYKKTFGQRTPKLLELVYKNDNLSLYAIVDEQTYNNFSVYGMYGAIGGLISGVANSIIENDKRISHTFYGVKNNEKKAFFLGETGMKSKKMFKKIIEANFDECPLLILEVEKNQYKVKDIPKIVEFYNENCGN